MEGRLQRCPQNPLRKDMIDEMESEDENLIGSFEIKLVHLSNANNERSKPVWVVSSGVIFCRNVVGSRQTNHLNRFVE